MVRVVLIVLVAAGFFITGDIPSVVTGCKNALVAVQNKTQEVFSSAESKISLGFGEQEQKYRLNNDVIYWSERLDDALMGTASTGGDAVN